MCRPRRPTATASWTAASSSGSTSSTPPTSTATVAGSPSRSSAAGSRRAAAGARRTVLATKVYDAPRPSGRTTVAALGAAHPPGLRGQPAAAADRPHRPVPDAPRRPRHAVGRDLAGDGRCSSQQGKVLYVGSSNFAGWHIAQANEARQAARLARARVASRASTTSTPAPIELEVLPACAALRRRRDPVEPARRRPARRRRSQNARPAAAAATSASQDRIEEHRAAARGVGEALRRARRAARRRRAGLAARQPGRSPRRSSGRARSSSSTARWARSTSQLDADALDRARRDLPRPGRSRARGVRLVTCTW